MSAPDELVRERAQGAAAPLPPMERIFDHAADQLIELLTDDGAQALVDACRDPEVRAAADQFLRLLVARRDGRRR